VISTSYALAFTWRITLHDHLYFLLAILTFHLFVISFQPPKIIGSSETVDLATPLSSITRGPYLVQRIGKTNSGPSMFSAIQLDYYVFPTWNEDHQSPSMLRPMCVPCSDHTSLYHNGGQGTRKLWQSGRAIESARSARILYLKGGVQWLAGEIFQEVGRRFHSNNLRTLGALNVKRVLTRSKRCPESRVYRTPTGRYISDLGLQVWRDICAFISGPVLVKRARHSSWKMISSRAKKKKHDIMRPRSLHADRFHLKMSWPSKVYC
jgi:hypothetical protein